MVQLINKFFHSIYSKDSADVNGLTTGVVNPNLLLNVTTTAFEVQEILRRLDINKSPGVDNIPSTILFPYLCEGIVGSLVTFALSISKVGSHAHFVEIRKHYSCR